MIVINQMACSPSFNEALAALEKGRDVRSSSWPAGLVLRKQGMQISVIRDGQLLAPGLDETIRR
jgi:hypothetical protein